MNKRPYFKNLRPNATANSATAFFTARQLANIYGFPAPNLSLSPIVGVLSFGGGLYGNIDANGVLTNGDVQKYWAYEGIAANQMPKVVVELCGGARNTVSDKESTIENTLDVAVIGSSCPNPNLTIVLFIFPNTGTFAQAFQTVISGTKRGLVPTIISVSWGLPESYLLQDGVDITGDLAGTAAVLTTATHLGVNICVAAGDNGSADGTTQLSCDFPGSCPYVTSVGGTTLSAPNGVYGSEQVWNDGLVSGTFYATGGGVSTYFAKPAYQKSVQGNMRCVPDIALNADPDTGIVLFINGTLMGGIGGTSMSAPLFAGYLASIGTTGFVNPQLYSAPANCFRDITVGCNYDTTTTSSTYKAVIGYDCCTGLGSIVGNKLASVLAPTAAPTPVSILATSITTKPTSPIIVQLNAKTVSLTASISPSNVSNKSITWTSSNAGVATVSSAGLVSLIQSGSVIITATTADGSNLSASTTIVISAPVPVSGITLTPNTISLSVGKTASFRATVSPPNAANPAVKWYSNNTKVVSINPNTGIMTAISQGTAFIAAYSMDGSNKFAIATVVVAKSAKLGMAFA